MSSILASPLNRAGIFFALGFLIATGLGALLGDVRVGLETGLLVGFGVAAFAVLFIRPNEPEPAEGGSEGIEPDDTTTAENEG